MQVGETKQTRDEPEGQPQVLYRSKHHADLGGMILRCKWKEKKNGGKNGGKSKKEEEITHNNNKSVHKTQ